MKSLAGLRCVIPLVGLGLASAQAQETAPTLDAAPAVVASAEQAGFVKSVRGDVQLQGSGGTLRPASAGEMVAANERIVTGPNSAAGLVLRDGTTLVVGPASRLDLKSFSFDATTHAGGMFFSLLRGSLRMVTGLLGKTRPESVRITTATATIGIRGTDFIVEADEQP